MDFSAFVIGFVAGVVGAMVKHYTGSVFLGVVACLLVLVLGG